MLLKFRRVSRSRSLTLLLISAGFLAFIEVFTFRWKFLSSLESSLPSPDIEKPGQRIFVASTHWNNEAIIRNHWNAAVLALVQEIGVQNVYISIYESGSWDYSKAALRLLDQELAKLGVARTVILDETTHVDEIEKPPAASGWIDTPRGQKELRRIPYLSRLRNLSLDPLYELAKNGTRFDKILFLNDIVFNTNDYRKLLNTNEGNYAAACAMDFSKPPQYYDTFALRDSNGEEPVMQTWPYFRSRASRQAVIKNQAVPLRSCWNGMTLMDAFPFYSPTSLLTFRGIPDTLATSHLEASECCLIHADNPISARKGVWLNPDVRVGYNGPAYEFVHRHSKYLTLSEFISGLWENRLRRWLTSTSFKRRIVMGRLRAWEEEAEHHYEPGAYCLINEMQVLTSNGWAHV